MKNKKVLVVIIIVLTFFILWFSDYLPKQVVKLVAGSYISQQENGDKYKLKSVDYSPAHDCYFAYYYEEENPDGKPRNIGVYYRYFPFFVFFDSEYPG